MQLEWVAFFSIIVGLVGCFFGYAWFRAYLIFVGAITGYILAQDFLVTDQQIVAIVVGVIVALIMALIAYPLWSIGVALSGVLLGFFAGINIGMAIGLNQTGLVFWGIVCAIVGGLLFARAKDVMVMLATAFYGAILVVYGVGLLLPQIALRPQINPLALIIIIVLAAFGFGVQYRAYDA